MQAASHCRSLLQGKLAQLHEGIAVLTARLREEVALRSGDLLSQATALREADDTMQVRPAGMAMGALRCSQSLAWRVGQGRACSMHKMSIHTRSWTSCIHQQEHSVSAWVSMCQLAGVH